jgi:SsrA-binding protein
MAKKDKKAPTLISTGVVNKNRRAFFDYDIEEKFEAGLVLTGTEVKSLRNGRANIKEAFAVEEKGELYLSNIYISEYSAKGYTRHDPRRKRKLLLHKKELERLIGAISKKGYTIVPIKIYFNSKGIAKVQIGLGTGKKLHDKRQDKKEKDWNRDKARILRSRN